MFFSDVMFMNYFDRMLRDIEKDLDFSEKSKKLADKCGNTECAGNKENKKTETTECKKAKPLIKRSVSYNVNGVEVTSLLEELKGLATVMNSEKDAVKTINDAVTVIKAFTEGEFGYSL